MAGPLLAPVVSRMPVISSVMAPITRLGNSIQAKLGGSVMGKFAGFLYEEGFQEVIPGLLGGKLFKGNQEMSEIFQEVFDRQGGGIKAAIANHSVVRAMSDANITYTDIVAAKK